MPDQFNAKRYISNGVKISVKTVAIGAIADFEDNFGYLWGSDKPKNQRDEDELEWGEVWQKVRTSILDRANNSQNTLLDNLKRFSISKKKVYQEFNDERV